jgi:hypothetical protein
MEMAELEAACRVSVFILLLPTQSNWRAATRQPAFKSTRRPLAGKRGIDVKGAKRKRSNDDVRRFNGCEMELARGASHIASMLYEHSIHAAVRETLLQFEAFHGREDLKGFAYALLGRLEQRCKPEAVKVLHDFIEHVSTPKAIAPKQRFTRSRMGRAGAMTEAA